MRSKQKQSTRGKILSAAMFLAHENGFMNITAESVARQAGVVPGTVFFHFSSIQGLTNTVVEQAIETKQLKIIAQAIATNHRFTRHLPPSLRKRAVDSLH